MNAGYTTCRCWGERLMNRLVYTDFLRIADEIESEPFYTGVDFFYRQYGGAWRPDVIVRLLRASGMGVKPDPDAITDRGAGLETTLLYDPDDGDLAIVARWLAEAAGWPDDYAAKAIDATANASAQETAEWLRIIAAQHTLRAEGDE